MCENPKCLCAARQKRHYCSDVCAWEDAPRRLKSLVRQRAVDETATAALLSVMQHTWSKIPPACVGQCGDYVSDLARRIVRASRAAHPPDQFAAKIRTLKSNLKWNDALLQGVLMGKLQPETLVTMTSNQLASSELRAWRVEEVRKYRDQMTLHTHHTPNVRVNGYDAVVLPHPEEELIFPPDHDVYVKQHGCVVVRYSTGDWDYARREEDGVYVVQP